MGRDGGIEKEKEKENEKENEREKEKEREDREGLSYFLSESKMFFLKVCWKNCSYGVLIKVALIQVTPNSIARKMLGIWFKT